MSLNSHYTGSNYSSTNETLIFRCVYGYFQNEEEQNAYIDKINNKKKIYSNLLQAIIQNKRIYS